MAGIKEVSNYFKSQKSSSDKVRTSDTVVREATRVQMKSQGRRRARIDTRPVVRGVKGKIEVYSPL